jgi:SAM-dependent methyltransferase
MRIPDNGTDGAGNRKAAGAGLAKLAHMGTYARRPELYDVVYSFKDYAAECGRIEALVGERAPHARTLLDVACGTGKHLEQLRGRFDCEGVDLDSGLLEIARTRLPGVPLHEADMRDFDLGHRFDVVVCLFSAIGYAGDLEGLHGTARSLARHLADDGLLIVEPWIDPEDWVPGRPHVLAADADGLAVARVTLSGREGNVSTMDMQYLVGTADGIEHFAEVHRVALFTREEMRTAFEAAGLRPDYDATGLIGRGLWIARRAELAGTA